MWILLDNYDSFTHILHHYLLQTGNECIVYRNDEITIEQIEKLKPERIIISPGPETPKEAGICMDVIQHFHQTIPILGVCLGHQAIGMFFGADLIHIPYPMHGKTSKLTHTEHQLFEHVATSFEAMRYHSLAIINLEQTGLLTIATSNDDNQIMAVAHDTFPCIGIQFHPESVGTTVGKQLLENWAKMKF